MHTKIRGFTLIELMIAIAIIAILVAVAIPQYQRYALNAAERACFAEVKAYALQAVIALNAAQQAPTPVTGACTAITTPTGFGQDITGTPDAPSAASQVVRI